MRLSFFQETLLTAAAILALLLLVEAWFVLPEPSLTGGPITSEAPPFETAPAAEQGLSFSLSPRESLRDFVDRPLFERDRRSAMEPYAPKDNITLVGIILNAEERIAILRPQSGVNPVRVRAGDTVGDWHVVEITQNSVLLRNDDNVQWVTLPGGG